MPTAESPLGQPPASGGPPGPHACTSGPRRGRGPLTFWRLRPCRLCASRGPRRWAVGGKGGQPCATPRWEDGRRDTAWGWAGRGWGHAQRSQGPGVLSSACPHPGWRDGHCPPGSGGRHLPPCERGACLYPRPGETSSLVSVFLGRCCHITSGCCGGCGPRKGPPYPRSSLAIPRLRGCPLLRTLPPRLRHPICCSQLQERQRLGGGRWWGAASKGGHSRRIQGAGWGTGPSPWRVGGLAAETHENWESPGPEPVESPRHESPFSPRSQMLL